MEDEEKRTDPAPANQLARSATTTSVAIRANRWRGGPARALSKMATPHPQHPTRDKANRVQGSS